MMIEDIYDMEIAEVGEATVPRNAVLPDPKLNRLGFFFLFNY